MTKCYRINLYYIESNNLVDSNNLKIECFNLNQTKGHYIAISQTELGRIWFVLNWGLADAFILIGQTKFCLTWAKFGIP